MKNELVKYLGVLILLCGVIALALHYFSTVRSNTLLAVGLTLIIAGILAHLVINKLLK